MFSQTRNIFSQQRILAATSTAACLVFNNRYTRCKEKEPKQESPTKKEEMFFDYCPKSQMHQPKVPYPAWDNDWDGKESQKVKGGVTKHYILIRHGQYDETFKQDEKRTLTALGRKQADLTGERIKEMIQGIDPLFKAMPVATLFVSNMTRAKETAEIIANHLPDYVERADPDPLLNEGIPAQIIPSRPELDIEEDFKKNGPRIEEAFQKYFSRSTDEVSTKDHPNRHDKHEVEIIVCHGNVIRYFFCRALQIPPESWLRMSTYNCSLTYIVVRPNGKVSARMMGDIGHLGYEHSTFSMNHGFVP